MIISFAHTTPALMARRKTVTRREWKDSTLATAVRAFEKGSRIDAWSQRASVPGARKVGEIVLVEKPRRESIALMPDSDWEAEGFAYLEEQGLDCMGMTPRALWADWRRDLHVARPREFVVVRFRVVTLLGEVG